MGVLTLTAAYSTIFVTLPIFALVAVLMQGFNVKSLLNPGDDYLSSRMTEGWISLGLSYFASAIGNWLLYTTPWVGATYSLWGIFGYSIGSAIPLSIMIWLGPVARGMSGGHGFAGSDLMRDRYGRVTQLIVGFLSLLYMWLCLVSELTTIAYTMLLLTNDLYPILAAIIPVAVVTLFYTMYAGLKASIVTDRLQGMLVLVLMLIAIIIVIGNMSLSYENWQKAVKGDEQSIIFCFVIMLSMYPAELCNQGMWQRIYASRSDRDLRLGLFFGLVLIMAVILLFGIMGLLAKTANPGLVEATVAFFDSLKSLGEGWLVLVAILALCLVASSVDTLQCGMVSLIGEELVERKLSMNWARLLSFLLNIPAIVVASYLLDILRIFLLADVMCMISLGPILLSIWTKTTNVGAIGGCVASLMTALICGWVSSKTFWGAILFLYPENISSIDYLITFILVPLVSVVATAGLSVIDVMVFNPEKWEKEVERRKQRMEMESISRMEGISNNNIQKLDELEKRKTEEI